MELKGGWGDLWWKSKIRREKRQFGAKLLLLMIKIKARRKKNVTDKPDMFFSLLKRCKVTFVRKCESRLAMCLSFTDSSFSETTHENLAKKRQNNVFILWLISLHLSQLSRSIAAFGQVAETATLVFSFNSICWLFPPCYELSDHTVLLLQSK